MRKDVSEFGVLVQSQFEKMFLPSANPPALVVIVVEDSGEHVWTNIARDSMKQVLLEVVKKCTPSVAQGGVN